MGCRPALVQHPRRAIRTAGVEDNLPRAVGLLPPQGLIDTLAGVGIHSPRSQACQRESWRARLRRPRLRLFPVGAGGNREGGANPPRSRHCDRLRFLSHRLSRRPRASREGSRRAGQEARTLPGEPGMGAVSQETCLGLRRTLFARESVASQPATQTGGRPQPPRRELRHFCFCNRRCTQINTG